MIPKNHIILGIIATVAVFLIFPEVKPFYLLLFFASSFLIDFDHYIFSVLETGSWSPRKAILFDSELTKQEHINYKKGIRKKYYYHVSHSFEFIILLFLIGLFSKPVFFIFLGAIFHIALDVRHMVRKDKLYVKEYSLIKILRRYRQLRYLQHSKKQPFISQEQGFATLKSKD